MKTVSLLILGGISLLGATLPASAHHGFAAEYDRTHSLTLVGKLTKVQLENPHGWLYIDAKDAQGKVVNWALELPGPAVLRRGGFTPDTFQTIMTSGEIVTVTAYAARDGSLKAVDKAADSAAAAAKAGKADKTGKVKVSRNREKARAQSPVRGCLQPLSTNHHTFRTGTGTAQIIP